MTAPLLETQGLVKTFGGLVALNNVNLQLEPGRLHAIIGPNGAGKTTFFNVVNGMLKPNAGRVLFFGQDITRLPPHRIAQLGVARTLQIKSVFDNLTVAQNVAAAAQIKSGVFRPFAKAAASKQTGEEVDRILEEVGLEHLRGVQAGTLSYGDVALLEIAIALATNPKVLLLDEPICGMGPAETESTVHKIRELAKTIDVIIIEHDMPVVFDLADEITVMAQGGILAKGSPEVIAADRSVREAYLGDEALEHA